MTESNAQYVVENSKHYVSWAKLDSLVATVQIHLEHKGRKPDVIMGISRGGLVPAVILSHRMNLPMVPLRWSTRDFLYNDEDTINDISDEIQDGKTVLIIDDICDTGHTFRLLADFFDNLPGVDKDKIIWAALHRREGAAFDLDICAEVIQDEGWVVYPYEQG